MADLLSGDPNPLAGFQDIVDDETPRRECAEWACAEIGGGRAVEAVVAELVAGGWAQDDAELICEDARRRTRELRGATTREDVAQAFGVRDPAVLRNSMAWGKPWAPFNALLSLVRSWRMKDVGGRR